MHRYSIGLLLVCIANVAFAWPEWNMQKQQSDGYIVGVGVADTRANARNAALAEIVLQLSANVSVKQTQRDLKTGGKASFEFTQQIDVASLPFELVGVTEIKHASKNNKVAIALGVKKTQLVNSLKAEISILERLSLPDSPIQNQFVYALDRQFELDKAEKILQVIEMLGAKQSELTSKLLTLKNSHHQILKQISVQVIGNSAPDKVIAAISNQFKWKGKTPLWLKPQLNWRHSASGKIKHVQASLHIELTRSSHPFNTLKEYNIVTTASADSVNQAKEKAVEQLVTILNRPIRQWNTEQ